MLADWSLIITANYALYLMIKEILWLRSFCKRGVYVYEDKKHSQQHITMVILLILYLLLMNWISLYEWHHYIIAFLYNLLIVPITIKHIESERLTNK